MNARVCERESEEESCRRFAFLNFNAKNEKKKTTTKDDDRSSLTTSSFSLSLFPFLLFSFYNAFLPPSFSSPQPAAWPLPGGAAFPVLVFCFFY